MIRSIMIFMLVFSLIFLTAGKKAEPELEEISALRYSYNAAREDAYICYEDILILGDNVYRKEDGNYIRTGETLHDMMGTESSHSWGYRQYENLIVTCDHKKFLIYDMDTNKRFSYPDQEDNESSEVYNWYLYDGYLYYKRDVWDEIRRIHLRDGEEQIVYRSKKDMAIWEFAMRGDGKILRERWSNDRREYYLIELYDNGEWKEEKIWETDIKRWKYVEWHDFNRYGLILVADFYDRPEGSVSMGEHVIIKEDGTIETFGMELKGTFLYLDEGCLLGDIPYSRKMLNDDSTHLLGMRALSVTYYDYEGNAQETYQLAGFRKIWEGYYIRRLLYQDGTITAIYAQKDTGELYIAQVEAEELQ